MFENYSYKKKKKNFPMYDVLFPARIYSVLLFHCTSSQCSTTINVVISFM